MDNDLRTDARDAIEQAINRMRECLAISQDLHLRLETARTPEERREMQRSFLQAQEQWKAAYQDLTEARRITKQLPAHLADNNSDSAQA